MLSSQRFESVDNESVVFDKEQAQTKMMPSRNDRQDMENGAEEVLRRPGAHAVAPSHSTNTGTGVSTRGDIYYLAMLVLGLLLIVVGGSVGAVVATAFV
jgi:hypothetical protein